MSVLPFRWHGAARREQIRGAAEQRLSHWLGQWAVSAEVECRLSTGDDLWVNKPNPIEWVLMRKDGVACLGLTSTARSHLGCLFAGLDGADTSGLAEGIGHRAILDLSSRLVGVGALCELLPDGAVPQEALLSPRCGAVTLVFQLYGYGMVLHIDATLCSILAPPPTLAFEPLVSLEEAMKPGTVTLEAVLDLGHANLAETVTLVPGEIITTDAPLSAAVAVMTKSGEEVFSGVLVAMGEHRGLRCTRTSWE